MPDRPTRLLGTLAIVIGLASLGLLAASVLGFRGAGWPWPRAYEVAGWSVWAALAGIVAVGIGLVMRGVRRDGAGRHCSLA